MVPTTGDHIVHSAGRRLEPRPRCGFARLSSSEALSPILIIVAELITELLIAERGVDVDHVTIYRWVQRFTPLLIDAAAVPTQRRWPLVRR